MCCNNGCGGGGNCCWIIILLIIILIGIIIVRYNRRMTRLATTDDLTGLVNRERFNAILSRKTGESPLVFMFDVDNFKSINDTYGHLRGNEVLASVARRARDIVGDAGLVARWGGDEFIGLIEYIIRTRSRIVALTVFILRRQRNGIASSVARLSKRHRIIITATEVIVVIRR